MEKQNSSVPALDKMDLIFDLLASSPEGLSQAAICTRLELPKATVSRMINRLSEMGYLEQNHLSGLYTLGAKLLTLGNLVRRRLDVAVVAAPHIEKLCSLTDEMVKLSIIRGGTVYPLRTWESTRAVRITQDSGTVYPPYIGAAGKLLLALTEEGRVYRAGTLPHIALEARTPYTITDRKILEAKLQEIEENNLAYDMQEESEGIYAIAMPVYDSQGEVAAAVSVPFFGDFQSKDEKYKPLLRECTNNISRSMGYKETFYE